MKSRTVLAVLAALGLARLMRAQGPPSDGHDSPPASRKNQR